MSAAKDRSKEAALQKARDYWLSCIKQWFPNLHDRTYFLPPVYFNQVSYGKQTIGGHSVLIPQPIVQNSVQTMDDAYKALCLNKSRPVFDSDARHDNAQFRVLHCLHALAEKRKEVMVVVSQLEFGKYLRKPSYTAAAEQLPRPKDLPRHYQRGDFDVLIIHSKYGLITGEVSSVGTNFTQISPAQKSKDDIIADKVVKAVNQLNRAHDVLTYLVSDLPHIAITKTLMLPSLSRRQLQQAVRNNQAEKALCDCLGVKRISQAVELCLCADDLSSSDTPWDVSDKVMDELESWWKCCFTEDDRFGSGVSKEVYEQLVARFCGPATTVEVPYIQTPRLEIKTEGEGVGLVGDRITKLCLYPEQVNVLNKAQSRVFLSGPPGTGKTIMLYLQAMNWLLEGHDVHVVSAYYCSRAVSLLLENQLKKSLHDLSDTEVASTPKVFRHDFDFDMNKGDVDLAVASLKRVSDGQLCVIIDEIVRLTNDRFGDFCINLISAVPDVYLWVASVFNSKIPKCLTEETVTVPLRTPPVVTRQIQKSLAINLGGHQYTTNGVPAPTDGVEIRHLFHEGQPGHDTDATSNSECKKCGRDIACVLKELQVGMKDQFQRRQELCLQYRDVFIVCENPIDFVVDDQGQMKSPCSGIVFGLRAGGFPVCLVNRQASETALRDMALGTEDKVIVAHWKTVQGLERKVVVVTGQWGGGYDRLLLTSRCTSQLIWVDPPP